MLNGDLQAVITALQEADCSCGSPRSATRPGEPAGPAAAEPGNGSAAPGRVPSPAQDARVLLSFVSGVELVRLPLLDELTMITFGGSES